MTALLDPGTIRRHVLPNGLTVLLRRDASAPVAAIVTHVKAGYFDETDDVVGIAHVLEHMYFKGTPRRGVGEIAKQTKAVGGYLNAGTIYDHTVYYTVVPSSGFARALDVQADAYHHSLIDAGELGRELEVIIQEARRKADNPGAVATETLYEMLFDRHRMRRWRIGREEGLRRLTRDDVVGFYRNHYRPGNTVLAVVGDVDPDAALREIEARYGGALPGEPERHPGPDETGAVPFRYRELSGDVSQAQLALGWRTVPTLHPDTPSLEILATILGQGRASRLYRAVRERKLASSIAAYDYTPTEVGVFVIHAEGRPETLADAARAAWAEVLSVREHGVTPPEVERAQRIVEARMIRRLEDMEGQATHLAEWEALGSWRLGDETFDRIMRLTADEVTDAARRHLAPEHAAVLAYRPAAAPVVAADTGAMRALLDGVRPAPRPEPAPPEPPPAAPTTLAAFEREEAGVRVYRTPGGVPVLVRRKPGAPMTHLGAFVQGGAIEETEATAGLTMLMTHTALKGTRTRSAEAIAEAGERLGGSVNAAVGGESFGWTISVPARRYAEAAELLADVVQHPTLPDEALERERATALAEVAALRDDMYRYPMRLAVGAAYPGHPYGLPVGGTEASLGAIAGDAVRAWHASRVRRSAAVVVVVGDDDPDRLAAVAAQTFSELEYPPAAEAAVPAWPAGVATTVESRDKAQTALCLLFPGPSRLDDDRYAAGLVAGIASGLGGRFFDELREKRSLAYTVHVFPSERRLAGAFGAYIATSPDREEEARAGLLAEFARLVDAPVSARELADAQTYALGTHAIRLQRGGAVLSDVVGAWLDGRLGELDEFEARVRAVTVERIQALARRYFDRARRVEGIVRGTGRTV
ncbi:MAG: insulinase family protein [Gemmatimonadota bacterium]|nr:insulinase family protein [Gemmatimonadota bacterium]